MTAADAVAFAYSALFFAGVLIRLHVNDRWWPTVARTVALMAVVAAVMTGVEAAEDQAQLPRAPASEARDGE